MRAHHLRPMEEDQLKTMSVPDAGWTYFRLSRNSSYAAAARGEIPTIRIGRILRVPVVAMERRLAEAGERASVAAKVCQGQHPQMRSFPPNSAKRS